MPNQPSRLTFNRLLLGSTSLLAWISLWEAFSLAQKLGIAPLTSKTWLLLLSTLVLTGATCLVFLILSFSSRFTHSVEGKFHSAGKTAVTAHTLSVVSVRWLSYPVWMATLLAYPLILFQPYYGSLLAKQSGIRVFLFWLIALVGMQALKLARPQMKTPTALLITILIQTWFQRVSLYLPDVSAYPFSMGWSETSRFYYPALFMGKAIFGQRLTWPILHPSLHFLLIPPYLLDLPLWSHRLWQVALRFLLVGLIAPALIHRLKISSRSLRWLAGLWVFVTLFSLPLYLHLAVPVFILLWGFSVTNNRRTWFWLVLASIWSGISRVNWYPMPGILAAALYFLEVPYENKGWRFLIKPAILFTASATIAFFSMQAYIVLSGISNPGNFFTSLHSTLLWIRLWPNESYNLGVLPGIIIFSVPLWLVFYFGKLKKIPKLLLLAELAVLFAGGIVVSMKIGGGADIHNMDAYAVLLLIIAAYILAGRDEFATKHPIISQRGSPCTICLANRTGHWGIIALLVLIPAWFSIQSRAAFWQYDPGSSGKTLTAIQEQVDQINAKGGEILFITQRHLISMHMLKNVTLVPEYEREELMEMAMAKNDDYLKVFRTEMEKHRFSAIIVDPLRFNLVGDEDAMGAENNAWTRNVVKKILCNYQQAAIFPDDRIAIYTPQVGEQKCP
ncbi:MAG: hypothetical protein WCK35_03760 [Chloroflexota bacterium]